jgi:hypothetical protein
MVCPIAGCVRVLAVSERLTPQRAPTRCWGRVERRYARCDGCGGKLMIFGAESNSASSLKGALLD